MPKFRWIATWNMDSPYDNCDPKYSEEIERDLHEEEERVENYLALREIDEEVKRDLRTAERQ